MNARKFISLLLILPLCAADDLISVVPEDLDTVIESATRALQVKNSGYLESAPRTALNTLLIARAQMEIGNGRLNFTKDTIKKLQKFDAVLKEIDQDFIEILENLDPKDVRVDLTRVPDLLLSVEELRLNFVYESKKSNRQELLETFDDAYVNRLLQVSDILHNLLSDEYDKKDSLFFSIIHHNHRHPGKTLKFARGILALIMRQNILESGHYYKEFNGTDDAMESYFHKSLKRFVRVTVIARAVYRECVKAMPEQIKEDHKRMIRHGHDESQCVLARKMVAYFNEKYPEFAFMSTVYDPLKSKNDHSLIVCQGSTLIQYHGHNSAVTYIPRTGLGKDFVATVKQKLDDVPKLKEKYDRAERLATHVSRALGERVCSKIKMMLVVTNKAESCGSAPQRHAVKAQKKVWRCKWPFCWRTKTYLYDVLLFG